MSKFAALATVATGTAAVTTGGVFWVRNGFGERAAPARELLFKSVGNFENGGKTKSKCVTDLFTVEFDDSGTPGTDLSGVTDFFNITTTDADPYKSCVIIDGKREEYENNKGKGKFTGTGTFVKGNEGFVNFNVAETISTETGKLQFTGVFYLLGKESNKWKVKHKKEVKENPKKVEAKDLDNYFPKVGTGLSVEEGKKDYGGFFKNTNSGQQLQNICGASDCSTTGTESTFDGVELHGDGSNASSSGGKKLKDWCSNLTWGSKLYEETSGSLDSKIESFEGTWSDTTNTPKAVPQESQ